MIALDPDTLIITWKMTGRLYVVPDDATDHADRWVHFLFQLDNAHQLRFSDSRKFGRVYLVDDPAEVLGRLGPEPLADDFTLDAFRRVLCPAEGRARRCCSIRRSWRASGTSTRTKRCIAPGCTRYAARTRSLTTN